MLKLVTGSYKKSQRGFTLLEVLVVIFIIALTTSLAVVTLGRDDQTQVDQHARQLLADFSFARDLALNQHRLVGWHPTQQGYRFSLRDSWGQWQPYTSRGLPERSWEAGVQLKESPQKLLNTNDEELNQPSLVFFSSGEVTPALLTLQLNSKERRLRVQVEKFELLDLANDH